jgi:hypothetical protein
MLRGRALRGLVLSLADGLHQHAYEEQKHDEQKRASLSGRESCATLTARGGRSDGGARCAFLLVEGGHVLHISADRSRMQLWKLRNR